MDKQKLVVQAKARITAMELWLQVNGSDEDGLAELELLRIALAALAGEPVYQVGQNGIWSDVSKHIMEQLGKDGVNTRILYPAQTAAISADKIMEIMQSQWNEWCDDTGHFPDDFEWKGGNGILSFEPSRWAKRVADDIIAEITPPAASRVPEGWKLVPIEPTQEMMRPWLSEREISADGYCTIGHDYSATAKRLLLECIAAAPSKEDE